MKKSVRLTWIAGALLLTYGFVLGVTNGVDVTIAGVRIRSRAWQRPAAVGLICIAAATVLDRRRVARVVATAAERVRSPAALAAVAAVWALTAGIVFGTYAAGGSDSSGYLNQARLFSHGRLVEDGPLPTRPPWPDAALTLTPLGYRPAPDGVRLAPTYPPGLPLIFAPAFLFDARAAYLIVPLCGALTVWLTYILGQRLGDSWAGAAAAVLVSVSPTFLHQVVQPLSDVPATAAWLLALCLAAGRTGTRAALAGVAAGLAVLIRPNLIPLAALVVGACAVAHAQRPAWRRAAVAAVTMAPALLALGIVQAVRYDSPVGSGYGSLTGLFSWANVLPNLDRYPRWMVEVHTPLIGAFIFAPAWLAVRRQEQWRRGLVLILWMFCLAVPAAYLAYLPFAHHEWGYTRFLLPAIPLMWLLSVAPAADLLRRAPRGVRALIAVPALIGLGVFSIVAAKERSTFILKDGERRYVLAGDYARTRLPSNAVIISAQHSGSVWFYARRPVLRWDVLGPGRLDTAIVWLKAEGYAPYIIADQEEFLAIKKRFEPTGQRSLERAVPIARFGVAEIHAIW